MSVTRKRVWLAVKSVLAVAIVAGVGWQFARILSSPALAEQAFVFRVEYLIPAGLLYLLAHCCWGTFWVQLLRSEGMPVSWRMGLRAYFLSQFGKYVPGKAWVILIRVALLRQAGGKPLPVAVTATYETLTSMAAGAMLGVLFLPWLGVLPEWLAGKMVFLGVLAALPLMLGVLNRLASRIARKARGPDAAQLPSPSLLLLGRGLLQAAVGWALLALSLGLTLRGVSSDLPRWTGGEFLGDLAAVTLSYVVGFVVLVAPGGLGARELLLQGSLTARFGSMLGVEMAAGIAVVAALVLRLVWTVAEVGFAGVLYCSSFAGTETEKAQREERADVSER